MGLSRSLAALAVAAAIVSMPVPLPEACGGPLTGVINPSSLAGVADVTITGIGRSIYQGLAVGDIDGNGKVDLAFADLKLSNHKFYLLYQPDDGLPSSLALSDLDGAGGSGAVHGAVFTNDLSNAGDFVIHLSSGDTNNDGLADLMIGIPVNDVSLTNATLPASRAGQAFLVYGSADSQRPQGALNLSDLGFTDPGEPGYIRGAVFNGYANDFLAGASAALGHDFNGDGVGDIVLGASAFDAGGPEGDDRGSVYFIYGRPQGSPDELLDTYTLQGVGLTEAQPGVLATIDPVTYNIVDHPEAWIRPVAGEQFTRSDRTYKALGTSLDVGDVNGDGVPDVVAAGGGGFAGDDFGAAYLISGQAIRAGDFSNVAHYDTEGTLNSAIVSIPGDVNGDGFDDVLISGGADGKVLIYGQAGDALLTGEHKLNEVGDTSLPGIELKGFQIVGAAAAVNVAGDFNGDGLDDLLISGPDSYLIYGQLAGSDRELVGTINLANVGIDPGDPQSIAGIRFAGISFMSGGQDINGDGIDDLVVTVPSAGTQGAMYVIYGEPNLSGDLDGDGFVDEQDLDIVLANWNQSVKSGVWQLGDASGDGFVGLDDLDFVLANWSDGTPPPLSVLIPEPASLVLLGLGGLAAPRRRR